MAPDLDPRREITDKTPKRVPVFQMSVALLTARRSGRDVSSVCVAAEATTAAIVGQDDEKKRKEKEL